MRSCLHVESAAARCVQWAAPQAGKNHGAPLRFELERAAVVDGGGRALCPLHQQLLDRPARRRGQCRRSGRDGDAGKVEKEAAMAAQSATGALEKAQAARATADAAKAAVARALEPLRTNESVLDLDDLCRWLPTAGLNRGSGCRAHHLRKLFSFNV